jgi:hypothetical protein
MKDDHEQREGQRERHDGVHHQVSFHRGDPDPVSAPTSFGSLEFPLVRPLG